MAFLTDLIKQAFTTDSSSNVALRAKIEGDQNLGGGYISNDQTTTNMMSKGTVYRFDGSDDTIAAGDAQDITTGDFAIHVKFAKENVTDANAFIVNKEAGGIGYGLEVRADDLWIRFDDNTTDTTAIIGTAVFTAGVEYDVFATFDRSGNATAYVNGISVGTVAISTSNLTLTNAGAFTIGSETGGTTKPFGGEIGLVEVYNFLPTQSQVLDLISGNIPFQYQYGSQTDLFDSWDFTSGWATAGNGTITDLNTFTNSGGAGGLIDQQFIVGKAYRLTIAGAGDIGTLEATCSEAAGANRVTIGTITASSTSFEFIANGEYLYIRNDTDLSVNDLTVIEAAQLGAVALLSQDSISDSLWLDLANASHGDVTGASVLNYKGAHSDGVDLYTDRKLIRPFTVSAKTTAATLTIAELITGILTGTHTAGATQAYTLPTGTLTDAALGMAVNDSFDWTLINLSAAAADTITVTAGSGHTVVGNMIVQSVHASTGLIYGSSGMFRTRKTAANTFVTYRIA